ncbi:MAG TPA: gamma-glutamylcyclotransferase family protein [Xanthobacteraceae bacterium]|nr:gamma-glutamylcyclotransferase family protein [Xanthobacteraceae bacterium]
MSEVAPNRTVCPDMLHFAYGSNMCTALMRQRCPDARLESHSCLPDYRFIIMRSGYASVAPAPGGCVHGLMWRLSPRDVAALNAYENLEGGLYRALTIAVVAHRRHRAALIYIGCDRTCGRPRPGYLDIVIQAARDAGFPPHYVHSLARWASAESNLNRSVFHGD